MRSMQRSVPLRPHGMLVLLERCGGGGAIEGVAEVY